ncbi:MAG: hypothetical protein KGJ13_08850 [Patescibacteria group bacterium]|nr:hypothetical protein [Patescibacteria group bacterium]
MGDLYSDWEHLIKETVRKLEESTRVVEDCTRMVRDQNRKARFIALCLGLEA